MKSHPIEDEPIVSPNEDQFRRAPFVTQTANAIVRMSTDSPSGVMALVGAWGSGKTSILNMISAKLQDSSIEIRTFNPWMVTDIRSLTVEFLTTLTEMLPKDQRAGVRVKWAAIARNLAPIGNLANAGDVLNQIGDVLDPSQSIENLHEDLKERLGSQDKKFLIIVDDLDRLQSDELLLVFKLIRLLGRLPNVHYLLAYDENSIIDVLTHSTLAASRPDRARAYIEKMVQARFTVPQLHSGDSLRLFDSLLGQIASRNDVEISSHDAVRLGASYQLCLHRDLTEPRAIKRLCTQIDLHFPLLTGEVEFVDFAITEYLRLFYPKVVEFISVNKGLLVGSGDKAADEAARELVEGTETVDIGDHVKDLLALMFRRLADRLPLGYAAARSKSDRYRGIDNLAYFDRYIHLGVGPDDISDQVIMRAIEEILAEVEGEAHQILRTSASSIPHLVASKMRSLLRDVETTADDLLMNVVDLVDDLDEGWYVIDNPIWSYAAEVLALRRIQNPAALVERLVEAMGVVPTCRLVYSARGLVDAAGSELEPRFISALIEKVVGRLDVEASRPASSTHQVQALLTYWLHLDNEADLRSWTEVTVSKGPWANEDFLPLLTTESRIVAPDSVAHLGGVDHVTLMNCLDVATIVDLVRTDLEHHAEEKADLSWDSRIRFAHTEVARWIEDNRRRFGERWPASDS